MWKSVLLLLCLSGCCCAGPLAAKRNMPIIQRQDEPMIMEPAAAEEDTPEDQRVPPELSMMSTLTLPSNATSIRADITDNFSCENKTYGYYADVDNDCQIFHVCLPVTYADGKENTFRWSFICPEETIFSQESFTCMRAEDMTIECEESFKYYELNRNFGMVEEDSNKNNNAMSATNEEQQSSLPIQTVEQKPAEEQPIEMLAIPPAPALSQPIKETKKPAKMPVNNRRKPAQVQTQTVIKKKPAATFPLRKMPQVVTEPAVPQIVELMPSEEEEVRETVKKEEVKPLSQRFNKRPVSMPTSFKDKLQTQKPDKVTPNRAELYNQVRKRPTMFNKKDASTTTSNKPAEEAQETVAMAEPNLTEPEPTLKLESIFAAPEHVEASNTQVDVKIDNTAQASENAVVYAEPEAVTKEEKVAPVEYFKKAVEAQKDEEKTSVAAELPAKAIEELEIVKEPVESVEIEANTAAEAVAETLQSMKSAVIAAEEAASAVAQENTPILAEETKEPADVEKEPVVKFITNDATENMQETEQEKPVVKTVVTGNKFAATEVEEVKEEVKPIAEEDVKLTVEEAQEIENPAMDVTQEESAEKMKPAAEISQENLKLATFNDIEKTEAVPEVIVSEVQSIKAIEPVADTEEIQIANVPESSVSALKSTQPLMNLEALDEAAKQPEALAPIEAYEEIPAVIVEVEETKPASTEAHNQAETDNAVKTIFVETPKEELVDTPAESAPVETIITSNVPTEDASSQTLEEMMDAKPADAVETMAATPEMQEHDPMVQAMFANTLKHSSGGFKPVDPATAAEAEALITDFLSTLMKSENGNNKPIYPGESQATADTVAAPVEDTKIESVAAVAPEAEDQFVPAATTEIKKETVPEVETAHSQMDKNGAPMSSMLMFNHLPDSMYQIPVKVITAPSEKDEDEEVAAEVVEEVAPQLAGTITDTVSDVASNEQSADAEMVPALKQSQAAEIIAPVEEEATSAEIEQSQQIKIVDDASLYKPLSIDDVVELVKERLEQKPSSTKETWVETSVPQAVIATAESEQNMDNAPENTAEQQPSESQSNEEIVMPIYQRVVEADSNMLKAQQLLVNEPAVIETALADSKPAAALEVADPEVAEKIIEKTETAAVPSETQEALNAEAPQTEVELKAARSYRSRSMKNAKMDPRKRRFLFRSDAS